ncbi:hypothetical protein SAMN04488540_103231 [Ferrimonas sediminum]|uniref:Lipoprotein n=1 Tax=Ferrimonas sediminum TaxID=718193 RepID=A0A1G8NTQ1_9GAMM|nr:hypothetical protein [Ferrimonas sediminum]SDI83572.1 hypothetical protein SAMN04488540_103231 [Ferrimonas sediminum]
MKIINLLSLLFMSALLVGCGGGGGGGSDTPQPPTPTTPADDPQDEPEDDPAAEPQPLTTADLVASPQMRFEGARRLKVVVSLGGDERAFVSLYTHFEAGVQGYQPNYQRRLASGGIHNGRFETEVMTGRDQQQILVEVWFYDVDKAPLQKVFPVSGQSVEWSI